MAREAKAKAASCWLDRIMVTGAVMRHRTCAVCLGLSALQAQPRPRTFFPQERAHEVKFLVNFPFEKDPNRIILNSSLRRITNKLS